MPKFRTWFLSVAAVNKKTKELNYVRYKFESDADTVAEAFDAIHAAGFACVIKSDGRVRSAESMLVRLSTGEL